MALGQADQAMIETPQPPRPRRQRQGFTVGYSPDYQRLQHVIPEGLLAKAQAMVTTGQRGAKTAVRSFKSLEFHQKMVEEYGKLLKFHQDHHQRLLMRLGELTGERQRMPLSVSVLTDYLSGLDDAVLDAIAQSKGISTELTKEQMIQQLTGYTNGQN